MRRLFGLNTRSLVAGVLAGGVKPYYERVISIQPTMLIQYLRLNEVAGTAANDISTQENDGVYASVELANATGPDGVLCAHFDGTGYVNIYSAPFLADFTGQEFTIALWCKAENVSIWSDGVVRRMIGLENADGTNFIRISKTATAGRIGIDYKAGGTAKVVNINSVSTTDWFHLCMTVSKAADEFKVYINGEQTGTTQTGLGTWTGNLVTTQCNIGAYTQVPANPWIGWIAHSAIWKIALTPSEVLALANP